MQLSKISDHARERYAERNKGREGHFDVKQYTAVNRDMIDSALSKMAEHATEVYKGPGKDGKPIILLVQGSWMLICGEDGTLITLFKRDLGIDDEKENKRILGLQVEKIERLKQACADAAEKVKERREQLESEASDWDAKIIEWRKMAKDAEQLRDSLKETNRTLGVELAVAEAELEAYITELLGTKVFGR